MKYLSYLFIPFVVLICSCNDSIEIGNALLEDELVNVTVDTLDISAQTIETDSVLTFRKQADESFTNTIYLVGQLDGSDYGQSEAIAYFSPTLIEAVPDLEDLYVIDSVAMVLKLDSVGRYGDTNAVHDLELFRLTENIVEDTTGAILYSNQVLDLEPTPIISLSQTINYKDSIDIENYISSTEDSMITQALVPQLRFIMDEEWWTEMLTSQDTITQEDLEEIIPGFALKSTVDNAIIGLNLGYFASTSEIVFYMTTGETKREYRLPLGRLRHNNFVHDYSGSALETTIGDNASELLYLESQSGTNIEIDLDAINSLDTTAILNNATLELAIVDSADKDLYPSPAGIFASYIDDEGTETTIIDILISLEGVNLTERAGVEYYDLDLTNHLNFILDGTISSTKIKVFTDAKAQRPNRAIIAGTNHPQYPMRLKVVKTIP